MALIPASPGSFLESQRNSQGVCKWAHQWQRWRAWGQEFCTIFIVIGMSETHMGIRLLNIFPTKEIKSCFAFPHSMWWSRHCSSCQWKSGAGWQVFSATKGLARAHVCTHIPSKEGTATRLLSLQGRGHFPNTQPQWEIPQAGQNLCTYLLVFTVPTYRISRVLS